MKTVYWGLIVLWALCAGCGPKLPDGLPSLVKVQALLTYDDGTPVDDAHLSFISQTGKNSWTFGGKTDAQGKLQLRTQGTYEGIPEGDYKVLIRKSIKEGIPEPPEPMDEESRNAYQKWSNSPNKEKVYSTVDLAYRQEAKTPLAVKIDSNTKNIELKAGKKVKILSDM
ncbi:MAG: hypothetical protein Q4G69_07800 [Planctomycetia bacterium]|nr:hypothetical protein [Planctomycetia bacterium]